MPEKPTLPSSRTRQPREAPESLLLFVLVLCLLVTVVTVFWAHNPAANIFTPITEAGTQTLR